ncbi:hypothetical protein V1J52_22810 [Streptomyces sp. TRM 70351]|uniref:hypothetical protein n=1 Tax=Streptomyces sp. TRM 70351 TaxID=3116552 RepID=UPI002E7B43B1|nr:hypothetical protein [Streptomyces sp. TRM 70351]MEE1930974.1 hypothetical protein [Streptomyces sp. TRM 70351]
MTAICSLTEGKHMRTSARMTGTAAALAAALLLAGCGGGDDGGGDEKPAAQESRDSGADPRTERAPGTVQGFWTARADGDDLALTVVSDAVLLVRDGRACNGRVTQGERQTLTLSCSGGGGEGRTHGTVDQVDGAEMTVSWNGGATDTFERVADAPKDAPTGLGGLEDLLPPG